LIGKKVPLLVKFTFFVLIIIKPKMNLENNSFIIINLI
jgi:hypothetical protein